MKKLFITAVGRCDVFNYSLDVLQEHISEQTKGLVNWSIPNRHIFPDLFRSFAGFQKYITINENGSSIGDWGEPIPMIFQNCELCFICIEYYVCEIRFWNCSERITCYSRWDIARQCTVHDENMVHHISRHVFCSVINLRDDRSPWNGWIQIRNSVQKWSTSPGDGSCWPGPILGFILPLKEHPCM